MQNEYETKVKIFTTEEALDEGVLNAFLKGKEIVTVTKDPIDDQLYIFYRVPVENKLKERIDPEIMDDMQR